MNVESENGDSSGGGGDRGMTKIISNGNRDIKNELEKGNKSNKKGLGATLGIKFGVASLLKQSQVFTGFVGTIFQLLGALVDVILAPFLPILIPGIRLIASLVPYIAKYSQAVFDFLDRTIFRWFSGLAWSDEVKEAVKKALSAIIVGVVLLKVFGLWNVFKSLIDSFIRKPIWGLLKKMFPQLDGFFAKFSGKSMGDIIKIAGKAAINGIIKPMWDNLLIRLMLFADWMAAPFTKLWGALRPGAEKIMGATLDDLVRRVWTNGLKAHFVTPLLSRLSGIAAFIARPFASLWGSISRNVASEGDSLIARAFMALKESPVGKAIAGISAHLTGLFNWIPGMIRRLPVIEKLMKWLSKELLGKFGSLLKGAKGLYGAVKSKTGQMIETAAPRAASMLDNIKPSTLAKAAQGFKAVPVLGAVAELGFGAYATYKDYKKYGMKAAAGRAALTLANTTTALFDPTGLVSAGGSIASNIAMDQAYKRMLDPKDEYKRNNPDLWLEIVNPDGIVSYEKKTQQENNSKVNLAPGQNKDRVSMDYP